MKAPSSALLITLLVSLLLPAQLGWADPIPANRRTTWQGNVGVPGGIPTNRTVYTTLNASDYGNGNNDATGAVQAAVNACPANQVVVLSAGTWRFNSRIYTYTKNNFTIRGAGMGQTVVKVYGGQAFYFGSADYPYPVSGVSITGGATAGSNVVTVSDTSNCTPGLLCHLTEANPTWAMGEPPAGGSSCIEIPMLIVSRSTSSGPGTVTLNHSLPITLPSSPQLVVYSKPAITGVGIENLTIDCQGIGTEGLDFEQSYGCWLKGVEITHSKNRQMFLIVFNQGTISGCYTNGTTSGGPNHEGIDFYIRGAWNLIEDNICDNGGFPSIIFGDSKGGCVGNVVAYNYIKNVQTATPIQGAGISFHGGENMFNLIEGNIVETGISGDGLHGGTAYTTVFRNWSMGKPYTAAGINVNTLLRAVYPDKFNVWWNVVGNVLGDSTFPASPNGVYQNALSDTVRSIYRMGYPNMGNNGFTVAWGPQTIPDYTPASYGDSGPGNTLETGWQKLDLNVSNTILRHGNYDYFNRAIVWDSGISDHSIPSSYYLTGKPSWFGNLAWPPIDPTNPNIAVTSIPAGYRYVNGSNPPAGGGSTPTPPPTPAPSASPSATPNPTPTPTPTPSGATPSPTAPPTGPNFVTIGPTDATITSPFVLNGDNTISQSVQTTDPTVGGKAVFHFNLVTSGTYVVVADVNCPDGGSNSFFVNIDADPNAAMAWNVPITNGLEYRSVNWAPNIVAQIWTLDAGPHDLIIRGREAGAKVGQITIAPPLPPPTNFRISGP